jgi:hypothetical protein
MLSRAETIRRATLKARASWTAYTEEQLAEILDLLETASDQIGARIIAYGRSGSINKSRLQALQAEMQAEIVRLRRMLTRHITSGVGESVDQGMASGVLSMASGDLPGNYKVAVGTGYISASGRVVRYSRAAEAYRNSTWAKIHGRAMDYLIRANPEGLTLSEKVWNVTWEGEKAIRRAVNLGVLQGKAPAKISREIRGFLAEPDRLYRRVRRGGRLVLSRPAAAYHPGRGVYRSSAKNAMRLARTEYQRAFHEGMVRYMAEKTWIDGGIWRIGNVDACEICMELRDRFFPKDEIPEIPHPQCLCHVEPHIAGEPLPDGVKTGKPDPSIIGDLLIKSVK